MTGKILFFVFFPIGGFLLSMLVWQLFDINYITVHLRDIKQDIEALEKEIFCAGKNFADEHIEMRIKMIKSVEEIEPLEESRRKKKKAVFILSCLICCFVITLFVFIFFRI